MKGKRYVLLTLAAVAGIFFVMYGMARVGRGQDPLNVSIPRQAVSTCTPQGVQAVWQDNLGQVIAQDIYSFLYLWDGSQFKKTGTSSKLYDYKVTTIDGHVYKVTGLYEITVDDSNVVQLCS